jgi:hypothetical protein
MKVLFRLLFHLDSAMIYIDVFSENDEISIKIQQHLVS